MGLPYEEATSGERALGDIRQTVMEQLEQSKLLPALEGPKPCDADDQEPPR